QLGGGAVDGVEKGQPRGEQCILKVAGEDLACQRQTTKNCAPEAQRLPRALKSPNHEWDAGQRVDHARMDQVPPDEAAQTEYGRSGEGAGMAQVTPQPEIRTQPREPYREHRVEIECLPGQEPRIKQIFEWMQIACLALAE